MMMKYRKLTKFPCIAVLALWTAVVAPGCGKEAPPPPPPPEAEEAPAPPPRPIVTQEKIDKLLYDMLYKDVVDFMGMEPSRQESTYNEGVEGYTRPYLISWYIWENPDGSFARLGFTKDKLTDITSQDLPGSGEASANSDAAP